MGYASPTGGATPLHVVYRAVPCYAKGNLAAHRSAGPRFARLMSSVVPAPFEGENPSAASSRRLCTEPLVPAQVPSDALAEREVEGAEDWTA
jgi:hypothetical protein